MTEESKHKGVGETAAAFETGRSGRTLKVRRIGNSLGVVLPKDVLAKLRVGEGDELSVSDTPSGVALAGADQDAADLMKLAEDIMAKRRRVLKALAQ